MNFKHGHSNSKEYRVWRSMIGRCVYPSHTSWKWYGARGIKVCERWLKFENFRADMGSRPFPTASIERKDSLGNYCPENCHWASNKEQNRNRSNNLVLTLNGKSQCAAEWAEELDINPDLISDRKCKGWTDERTLTEPTNIPHTFTFNGRTMTRHEWAKETGIGAGTIWHRLSKGWPIELVLTVPARSRVRS